jgi:hypothetical protein
MAVTKMARQPGDIVGQWTLLFWDPEVRYWLARCTCGREEHITPHRAATGLPSCCYVCRRAIPRKNANLAMPALLRDAAAQGVPEKTVVSRLAHKWSRDRIVNTPVRARRSPV